MLRHIAASKALSLVFMLVVMAFAAAAGALVPLAIPAHYALATVILQWIALPALNTLPSRA